MCNLTATRTPFKAANTEPHLKTICRWDCRKNGGTQLQCGNVELYQCYKQKRAGPKVDRKLSLWNYLDHLGFWNGLLAILTIGILGVAVAQNIAVPLGKLKEAAQSLGRGEFQQRDGLAYRTVPSPATTRMKSAAFSISDPKCDSLLRSSL